MKSLKLLLASLLVAGALQANEYRHNNTALYVAGLVSGMVIIDALASKHEVRSTHVVYKEPKYHKTHYKPHYFHKKHHKHYYSHKKHFKHNRYYAYEHQYRGRDFYYRDDRRR
jgi:hypothetical protein